MNKPWYKQFWPWFLIILPLSVVVASISTFVVFSNNKVSLVAEDYYKKGKGINLDLSKLRTADAMGVKASAFVTDDEITVVLDKGALKAFPTLSVLFQHRTLPDRDIQKMVNPDVSGQYRILLEEPIIGPWYIEIAPFKGEWILNGRGNLPTSDAIKLYGQSKE
ncbi:FixH family protein [Parasalinivibrio latis]|uniref:FixH family protein n=1 Tax=Parasalinivibrio latis TaxID=2952610 RepID=UPI0030E47A01